ncbi:MAG TPA: polysaccharide deacetylase family protein [Hyphomicrobiaceae bacterium]|nr:polysaccharide deacetylase family protein [Hyphomicrobiaceae bacterium]
MPSPGEIDLWHPVRQELAHWCRAGRTARLWLRDDDATDDTPALRRYAELVASHRAPVLLAVIPARATCGLADYLANQPLFDPAVHGYAHANHAKPGEKSQEFPIHRGSEVIRAEITQGRRRLTELFGERLTAVYVPPWNRISPEVAGLLPGLGFSALSAFGARPLLGAPSSLCEVNTHVDIIDWRGNRGGRAHDWLARELADQLALARTHGRNHVGLLTHHLVHDDRAWRFLELLLAFAADEAALTWCRVNDLIGSSEAAN